MKLGRECLILAHIAVNVQLVRHTGSEINFFWQAPTGDRNFFYSPQMEKCGRQKVSVKLFLCNETQAKIIGRHGLAGKIFAISVIRYQTVLKSYFDHFDRSKLPPFDAQRISKSSSNFFADVPSPPCNKLRKDFRTSLHTTSPVKYTHGERTHGPLAPAIRVLWDTAEKNMAAKLRTVRSCKTLW